jgi:cytochrome c2
MRSRFVGWIELRFRPRVVCVLLAAGFATAACGRGPVTHVPDGSAERGKQTIAAMGCGACHVISGVPGADGEVGPPLTGVARRAIIGGTLPNTPANMVAWIEDPPAIAPTTAMPNLGVTPQSARDIAAYLYTLR